MEPIKLNAIAVKMVMPFMATNDTQHLPRFLSRSQSGSATPCSGLRMMTGQILHLCQLLKLAGLTIENTETASTLREAA